MAIGNAVQRGSAVFVYDDNNRLLYTKGVQGGSNDGLKGYTGSRVNIKQGPSIFSYDERGNLVGTTSA